MQTSCSSWSYHRTIAAKKIDQAGWLRECARIELNSVELLEDHFRETGCDYIPAV